MQGASDAELADDARPDLRSQACDRAISDLRSHDNENLGCINSPAGLYDHGVGGRHHYGYLFLLSDAG